MFQKTRELFPVKEKGAFLAHCAISPLPRPACRALAEAAEAQMRGGGPGLVPYFGVVEALREAAARLLATRSGNVAFVKNTSEAMGMIANGYPFQPGDQILSYVHEYPANHYPWKLQEKRGVELVLLPDRPMGDGDTGRRPCGWSMEDVRRLTTERTRIIAVSHVQFTSGFAADLKELGAFCKERGIDLVVDAAQSLGALPVRPEEWNIAAVAASGWKWLFGPTGTGLFYTAPEFRRKLAHVLVGAESMVQGDDYLNHTWQPHTSARRFEYSTTPTFLAAALEACLKAAVLPYPADAVAAEIFRLQDRILATIDRDRYRPLLFSGPHRSGILSFITREDPDRIMKEAAQEGVFVSARCGYLRLAPHWCTTDEEVDRAVGVLNALDPA
ncbi:Selenocysteine lyase/Cysteine desulfurase [Desulfacinum hydrothermale DSM 13146]|uniref:Selenocysteine lyase/Cysteine desulfurase n=1 Tax=Desulfacinum hydrothermale DSM 13146 TaxID=1121390 RepID=A0A1W1XDT6_9BACT|nr:aminotransferase class V-fold PLP-dependent enzyme [Desulfacinum hydrothermale]SMC22012.1 Selenocysteine lyase/Cysteine desulfurase [Desulfacinum hydrothermale DSM 13146]